MCPLNPSRQLRQTVSNLLTELRTTTPLPPCRPSPHCLRPPDSLTLHLIKSITTQFGGPMWALLLTRPRVLDSQVHWTRKPIVSKSSTYPGVIYCLSVRLRFFGLKASSVYFLFPTTFENQIRNIQRDSLCHLSYSFSHEKTL